MTRTKAKRNQMKIDRAADLSANDKEKVRPMSKRLIYEISSFSAPCIIASLLNQEPGADLTHFYTMSARSPFVEH